jgi:hypothetical protein
MAKVILHPMILGISGKIGSLVFYSYRNNQYVRRYVIPKNPNTPAQRSRRELFGEAVNKWQNLKGYKKDQWNSNARNKRMSGYNLFISTRLSSEPSEREESGVYEDVLSYHIQSHSVYDKAWLLPCKSTHWLSPSDNCSVIRVESQTYH